jgi:hypothetical protein
MTQEAISMRGVVVLFILIILGAYFLPVKQAAPDFQAAWDAKAANARR